MTSTTIFTQDGLDIEASSQGITYLMGLSDFFNVVFEDKEQLSLLVGANAQTASDIYSRFLQITSTLSLENIQTFLGSSIELVFLSESNRIGPASYKIDVKYAGSAKIANKPFLPTNVLETGVDFEISQGADYSTLTFAKPLASYQFSQRVLANGSSEYAIWLTNITIDDRLISKYFGSLIGRRLENSSEKLTNFIYGMYYMYLNGPTLSNIEKGANLVLGVPLARDSETVLDIRNYLDTDTVLVITDKNQYLLPEGVSPSVGIDDQLSAGDLLATVVEIIDRRKSANWWLNINIPSSLIATKPPSQPDRIAKAGSSFATVMSKHLAKHTFLVRINVRAVGSNKFFYQMFDVINKAKPAYTQPIYTWNIEVGDDSVGLSEDSFSVTQSLGVPLSYTNSLAINEEAIG